MPMLRHARFGMPSTAARRAHPAAVVLQAAVNVIRISHVGAHVVELGDRNIVEKAPVVGLIERLVNAAIVAAQHLAGIIGIDPKRVKVAVHALVGPLRVDRRTEALAAILADGEKETPAYRRGRRFFGSTMTRAK